MSPQDAPLTFAASPLAGLPGISHMIAVLLFVSLVAWISIRFFYGKGILKPNFRFKKKAMKILERLPLGSNRSLFIVSVGEKVHLLGVTDQAINLLSEVDPSILSEETLQEVRKESPAG